MSFTSALPLALNISSAVSSTVTVTSLEKKCLGKKSAWEKKCLGCSIPASRILRRPVEAFPLEVATHHRRLYCSVPLQHQPPSYPWNALHLLHLALQPLPASRKCSEICPTGCLLGLQKQDIRKTMLLSRNQEENGKNLLLHNCCSLNGLLPSW